MKDLPKVVFFTEKRTAFHSARHTGHVEQVVGQPAKIPAWPGIDFFYRAEPHGRNRGHIITEARTGCLVAFGQTRARLHSALAARIRECSLADLKKHIARWPTCPKADTRAYA